VIRAGPLPLTGRGRQQRSERSRGKGRLSQPVHVKVVMPKGIVTHTQRVYLPRSTNRAWRGCRAQRRRSANAPIRRCQASQTVKHPLPCRGARLKHGHAWPVKRAPRAGLGSCIKSQGAP